MKHLLPLVVFLFFFSCVPTQIAPGIRDDKIMLAKKFQKKLPKQYAFIFEDSRGEGEFYYFINATYDLQENDVEWKVPFSINNETIFLSFYEGARPTKTINFVPILLNGYLISKGMSPWFEDVESSQIDHWFLVLTVSDSKNIDCLDPNHHSHKEVVKYLRALKSDYLKVV